jgi:hypothetical protein
VQEEIVHRFDVFREQSHNFLLGYLVRRKARPLPGSLLLTAFASGFPRLFRIVRKVAALLAVAAATLVLLPVAMLGALLARFARLLAIVGKILRTAAPFV